MVLEFLLGLVHAFGYPGVFLGSLIGSASVVLPVPSFLFVFLAGKLLNPFWVAIVAGLGSAIGELTSYGVGIGLLYGKRKLQKKKAAPQKKTGWSVTLKKWFHGKYGFWLIAVFAATPLPDDVIGLYCGAIRYDVKKFFLATLIGKIIMGLILAYAGFYSLGAFADYFA